MAADWRSFVGGIAGSVAVHFFGALWIVAALFGGPIREPGWRIGGDPYTFDMPRYDPRFTLAPVLFTHDRVFEIDGRDCGGRAMIRAPRLLGSGAFVEPRAMMREPRVCVRVEPDGQVTSARVLRSSGHRATDRAIEAHARALRFATARPGEAAVAVSATLDVIAGSAPAVATIPADGPGLPPL